MLKPLLALTAVGALAVPAATASAGTSNNDGLRVYVSNCVKQVYKPKTITIACADANFAVQKIKYGSYNARVATGRGTAVVNTCEPNCAAGKMVSYPAKIKLSRVTQCGDSYQFRRVAVTFTGKVPKGMTRTEVQSFPCADAPTR